MTIKTVMNFPGRRTQGSHSQEVDHSRKNSPNIHFRITEFDHNANKQHFWSLLDTTGTCCDQMVLRPEETIIKLLKHNVFWHRNKYGYREKHLMPRD